MDLLLYLPAGLPKPVPVLLNISFSANSNTVDDPGIKPGEIWSREKKKVPASPGRRIRHGSTCAPLSRRWFRRSDVLLRRHRSRLSRAALPLRRAGALPQGGADRARARRMGLDRRLGLGTQPRARLPRDRQGRGREARRHYWAFRAWARR